MPAGDQEAWVMLDGDLTFENAGSGVGATAVSGAKFGGIVVGVDEGEGISNDHSCPEGGISAPPCSNDPVPNDMEAV